MRRIASNGSTMSGGTKWNHHVDIGIGKGEREDISY
jgi:hypothetical protein